MKSIFASIVVLFLASCASTESTEQAAVRTETRDVAAEANKETETVDVGDHTFNVAKFEGQSFVVVGVKSAKRTYTGKDIETAAAMATGCEPTIFAGDWAFLGDLTRFNLSNLKPVITSPFPGWRVDLEC